MKRMRDGSYTIKPTYKVGEHDIVPDMLAKRAAIIASVPTDAGEKLVAKLREQGLAGEYHHYPDLTHGGLLGTSFKQALLAAAR